MNWTVLVWAAVLAVGALVLAILADKTLARRREKSLHMPPDQPLLEDTDPPAYLTETDIRAAAARDRPAPQLDADTRPVIESAMKGLEPLAAGWPSADFVTEPETRWAVVDSPIVLVTESVTRLPDLYPIIRLAQDRSAGLVVVAREIAPAVMATLSLNALSKRLPCLAVVTGDLEAFASRSGARVVEEQDLQSGYIPPDTLGHCRWWVSDAKQTWIIAAED